MENIAAPVSANGFPAFSRPNELASRLGLSPKTLAEWRMNGTGPEYVAAGARCILYPAISVERWLASRQRASTSDTGQAAA